MITAGRLDILVETRHAPLNYTIAFNALNLTGATLDMHVRMLPGSPGSPLINLNPAAPPAEGLSLAYDSGTGVTTVTIIVAEATLEGLPYNPEQFDDDAEFWWDLMITPSGGTKAVYLRGTFTVKPGITS